MKRELPELDRAAFAAHLAAVSPVALDAAALDALFAHYRELARWSGRLSLIGPGTIAEVFARHYGESLAALPLLPPPADPGHPQRLLDVGSGAGFPGFVLAAARPDLEVTLVEPRQRKWAFLRSAARRAALPVTCLDARVETPPPAGLPPRIELVTVRALKLTRSALEVLVQRLTTHGRLLLWLGGDLPSPPPAGTVVGDQVALAGSERRRIVAYDRAG